VNATGRVLERRTWYVWKAKYFSVWVIERMGPRINYGIPEAGSGFEGNRHSTNSLQ
jgi:hypothetical protein